MSEAVGELDALLETPLGKEGKRLFLEGKVESFAPRVSGYFVGEVDGEKVGLSLRQGRLVAHSCSCLDRKAFPGPCKHVVALLLAVNEAYC